MQESKATTKPAFFFMLPSVKLPARMGYGRAGFFTQNM